MSDLRRFFEPALRVIIAGMCLVGIWDSWKFARADYLFLKDTKESVQAAAVLVPDGWDYYMRLAQFEPDHARELLETAVHLNPYNAQADIELGLQYEAEERFDQAEKALLTAFDVDHTYLPRWTLANYYFRRDDMPAFWKWIQSAADMPPDDMSGLFQLCWRISPNIAKLSRAVLNDKPGAVRQYIEFLLAKGELAAMASVAGRLTEIGDPVADRPLLFSVIDRLVAANDGARANDLWHSLMRQGWVTADSSAPNNGSFGRAPLAVSLDWKLPEYSGVHSWPGASGLETEFDGREPEECVIAEQNLPLAPGKYTLTYSYRTSDIQAETGIQWRVVDPRSNTSLAHSTDLSSDEVRQSSLDFAVPAGATLVNLRLAYQRSVGTPRISGMLDVVETQIRPTP